MQTDHYDDDTLDASSDSFSPSNAIDRMISMSMFDFPNVKPSSEEGSASESTDHGSHARTFHLVPSLKRQRRVAIRR